MILEKGLLVLIYVVFRVIEEMGDRIKFIMIGGGKIDYWKQEIWNLGILERFYFIGFMFEEKLDKFQAIVDCVVFFSLYELFGIVVLESFVVRVLVVVLDIGGLLEVVEYGKMGIVIKVGNFIFLVLGILEVLKGCSFVKELVNNVYQELENKFCWGKIVK